MVNTYTNITSHLKSMNIKTPRHMTLEILQAWDSHKNVAELNRVRGLPPSPLHNLISKYNIFINKQQKTSTDSVPLKNTKHNHKK